MAGAGRSVASFVETRLAALTPEMEKAAILAPADEMAVEMQSQAGSFLRDPFAEVMP